MPLDVNSTGPSFTQSCLRTTMPLQTDFDYFQSPNYPANYPNNENCTYIINGKKKFYKIIKKLKIKIKIFFKHHLIKL